MEELAGSAVNEILTDKQKKHLLKRDVGSTAPPPIIKIYYITLNLPKNYETFGPAVYENYSNIHTYTEKHHSTLLHRIK